MAKKHLSIDETLILQIAKADMEAFERLYRETYKPMYAFLLSMTQNQENAQDLLQETYLKIAKAAADYVPQGNPMAWMMKIAKNEFLMDLRKKSNMVTVPIEDQDFETFTDDIKNLEDRMVIQHAFEVLSEEERTILVMYQMAGMKHREIAKVLDMPLGTVLAKYNRGIKKLKKKLT